MQLAVHSLRFSLPSHLVASLVGVTQEEPPWCPASLITHMHLAQPDAPSESEDKASVGCPQLHACAHTLATGIEKDAAMPQAAAKPWRSGCECDSRMPVHVHESQTSDELEPSVRECNELLERGQTSQTGSRPLRLSEIVPMCAAPTALIRTNEFSEVRRVAASRRHCILACSQGGSDARLRIDALMPTISFTAVRPPSVLHPTKLAWLMSHVVPPASQTPLYALRVLPSALSESLSQVGWAHSMLIRSARIGVSDTNVHGCSWSRPSRLIPFAPLAWQPQMGPDYCMGFLTMEQTRKLVLMSESDPKAFEVPLVGLWVAGVDGVQDPYVWAACTYYSGLQESARAAEMADGSGAFLLLAYLTGAASTPVVFECAPQVRIASHACGHVRPRPWLGVGFVACEGNGERAREERL